MRVVAIHTQHSNEPHLRLLLIGSSTYNSLYGDHTYELLHHQTGKPPVHVEDETVKLAWRILRYLEASMASKHGGPSGWGCLLS